MKIEDALEMLELNKDYYRMCALQSATILKWVLTLHDDELPLHINHADELAKEMVLARFRGENILDNPAFVLKSIDDLGEDLNEAVLTDMDLAELYKYFIKANDIDHANEARSWIYNDDNIPEEEEVNA